MLIIVSACAFGQTTVTVDASKEYQTIQGFGAFGGVRPYWEAPPFHTNEFLNYLLDDLGATIVRTNIFWDLEPVNENNSSTQLDLGKFNYKAGSNLARQLPYYKALKEAGLKKLIATSWTPPEWMKLHDDPDRIPKECYNCNNCAQGDPRRKVCGGRLDPKYYKEYAEYLVAYVKILQEAGIDLFALSLQNEPYFANPFESSVVKPDEYGSLLNFVGARFREEGLTTKLFGPEHMAEWSWGVQKNYVSNIFSSGEGNRYLDIYAVHGYVDGVEPDFGSAEGWTSLKDNISEKFGKPLWMTETSGYPQTFEGAMKLAQSMYLALRFGEISAWVYWSISAEPGSEFALMANGEPTVLYYASKQFFRYIRPGARRLETNSNDPEVLPLAFQNSAEGSMTLLFINNADAEKTVTLDIAVRPAQFAVYRTSDSENSAHVGTITNVVNLPPRSITTAVGHGAAGPSINEISNYVLHVGDDGNLEIPLTGIDAGAGSTVNVEATSTDPEIVPDLQVNYHAPSEEGSLILKANTSEPGKTVITVKLTNGGVVAPPSFGFISTEVSFTVEVVDLVTGSKKKVDPDVRVYPNPVNERVLVVDVSRLASSVTVEVTDTRGNVVKKLNRQEGSIFLDTQDWTPGVYFIRVSSRKTRTVEKIIIN